MGKRNKVTAAGLIIFCCLQAGCQQKEADPVTITVIHAWGSTEADHVAMREIFEDFETENPDIQVQLISMPTRDEMLRKVEDMIMVGDAPDIVAFGGMGQNETYEFMVENDMALNYMPYLEEDSGFAETVSDTNLEYWTTEAGELYNIADVLSLSGGYWYNEDMFEQAGITEIPATWEEFSVMCRTLQDWSQEQDNEVKPLQASAEGYLYFYDHMEADGGDNIHTTLERMREIYRFSTSENADYSYRDETSLFNEGKLAIYINGVWGAPMISEDINAKYALLPTESGDSMSCESVCLGYVLGNSGNEEKEAASVQFVKYMLSETVQKRILEETEQIPANSYVELSGYEENKPRLYQAASLVLGAQEKIEVPDNLWTAAEKNVFTENILEVLSGELTEEEFNLKLYGGS